MWGGDPAHNHVWSTEGRRGGPAQKQGATSQRNGRSNVDEQIQRSMSTGQSCACGSWLGELGQEPSPDLYVEHLVEVFREVWRVMRKDSICYLNIGDTYSGSHGNSRVPDNEAPSNKPGYIENMRASSVGVSGLKQKDLVGVPWRVAFALQAEGWYLRNAIVWASPNPMPESVIDRFTNSYEMVFMLTKSAKYYFDSDSVREPHLPITLNRVKYGLNQTHPDGIGVAMPPMQTKKIEGDIHDGTGRVVDSPMGDRFANPLGRNRRDVWTIPTVPYKGAHYAVMPANLVEPMILSATSAKGVCPQCGAPWRRVTERIREARGDAFGVKDIGEYDHGQAGSPFMEVVSVETLGWVPTCEHDLAADLRECQECGAPYKEIQAVDPFDQFVNPDRPQSVRAAEVAREKGLTVDHIHALRAAGITDTGKSQMTQDGFGNNTEEVQRLATEAKAALGSYTREFTFIAPRTTGWEPTCEHKPVDVVPAVILDPFGGSGTVGKVAQEHSRRAILIELNPEYLGQQITRNQQVPLGLDLSASATVVDK